MRKINIFLLLILAVVLRCYKIYSPIIGMNSWRLADTAAIARNYYESGYDFFHPQIDWRGNTPGYIETEFPIYSFVVAVLYKVFGVHELIGRTLSIIFSLITIYFLYLLVLKLLDKKTALWACFFYAILPPAVFYSRTFQPESALMMSIVLGIYFFACWLDDEKVKYFVLSSLFISLACLLKIPSLYIGLPILYLSWVKFGKKLLSKLCLWLYGLLTLLPVAVWSYHSHNIFLKTGLTFGIWEYGVDKWGNWSLVFTFRFWNRILFQNLAENYFTWIGFILFIMGIFLKRKTKQESLFDVWAIAMVIYFIVAAKGNFVHLYYQLPFIIPGAVYMSKLYSRYFTLKKPLNKKSLALMIGLIGIVVLSVGRYQIYMKKENLKNSEIYKLAKIAKKEIKDKALVIAVDHNDPTLLYLCHKKGWHSFPNQLDRSFLSSKKRLGARYILGNHSSFTGDSDGKKLRAILKSYKIIHNDKTSFIIEMSE